MRFELPSGTTATQELVPEARRGLVVIPDIMGVRPLFDEMVARLADQWGWSTCCAELYPGREDLDLDGRLNAASSLRDDRVLADVNAAADATGCDQVGVIGFCMGGMYTMKAVGTGRFFAAVAFYGMIRVPAEWRGPGQGEPLAEATKGDPSTLLAIVGDADPYTPPEHVAALAAVGVEIVSYANAEHGFVHDPHRPAHRAGDADDAWRRAHDWLAR